MMGTEHTPLPWTFEDSRRAITHTPDGKRGQIVIFDETMRTADATLIVHSVNLLPELVEALREARADLANSTFNGSFYHRIALERIDALLAKATS